MKSLIVFAFIFTFSAQADCDYMEKRAKEVIQQIKKYKVQIVQIKEVIQTAEKFMAEGKFCTTMANPYILCNFLSREYHFYGMETEDPREQYQIDTALKMFGGLFSSSDENNIVSCDLKKLRFTTMEM